MFKTPHHSERLQSQLCPHHSLIYLRNSDLCYTPPTLSHPHSLSFPLCTATPESCFPIVSGLCLNHHHNAYTVDSGSFSNPSLFLVFFPGYFWFPGNSGFKVLIFKLSEIFLKSASILSAWLTSSNFMTLLLFPVFSELCMLLFPVFSEVSMLLFPVFTELCMLLFLVYHILSALLLFSILSKLLTYVVLNSCVSGDNC